MNKVRLTVVALATALAALTVGSIAQSSAQSAAPSPEGSPSASLKTTTAAAKRGPRGKRGARGLRGTTGARGATGSTGAGGSPGPAGATGSTGATGAAGRSALSPLQSGESVHGVIGVSEPAGGGGNVGATASLPIPASNALDSTEVTVDNGMDTAENTCAGTAANPTSPPGVVCVYLTGTQNNITQATIQGVQVGSGGGTPTPFGFQVLANSIAAGQTSLQAIWAYTAP